MEEPRAWGSPGQEPQRHEGYLLKKRKWPLKGWHKVTGHREPPPWVLWSALGQFGPLDGGLQGSLSAPLQPSSSLSPEVLRARKRHPEICHHAPGRECGAGLQPPHRLGAGGDPLAPLRKVVLPLTGLPGPPPPGPQGQTARSHRHPSVRHVYQQEGAAGRPGHGGEHLPPQGAGGSWSRVWGLWVPHQLGPP